MAPLANTYGDIGRGILYGPGHVNFDTSLSKRFAVIGRTNVEFRWDAFNLFNHPGFGFPNQNFDSPTAGRITIDGRGQPIDAVLGEVEFLRRSDQVSGLGSRVSGSGFSVVWSDLRPETTLDPRSETRRLLQGGSHETCRAEMLSDPPPAVDRRSFFKTLGLDRGALALTGEAAADAAADFVQANVKRASEPSALKITDLRVAVVANAPMTCPLIRIDTNQGLVGWGEVRDGASETYALMLKSRILGENPCNVDRIFRKIKQFGAAARQAGGVCGVEMAMMDLAGKAWGVPCWQMLGGRFRDRVRLYADTTERDTRMNRAGCSRSGWTGASRTSSRTSGSACVQRRSRCAVDAARHEHRRRRAHHAPVHRDRDHRQGHRVALRLGRPDPRGHRHGDSARLGPLRPHQRQQLHQARAGDGEVEPGVDGGHGALAVRRADEADPRRRRPYPS